MTPTLQNALEQTASKVESVLANALKEDAQANEITRPQRLTDAMQYAALAGGKRLRPLLMVEVAKLFGREDDGVLTAAAALECIHCYSLVHDDLPAMDDDDLRRGKPTTHKAFDEATAILAGDALLTFAFDLIAREDVHQSAALRLQLSQELARASGIGGMAGGQMLDLQSEHSDRSEAQIRTLQAMKTGALIRYACRAGAMLAQASNEDIARLTRFGEIVGLAFQLADDLLDVTSDAATLGKAAGKDEERGKATLVGLMGQEHAREELAQLIDEAAILLAPFGNDARTLIEIADFIAKRTH
ncbi:polyprenyl synthetase family protein [Polycladidibacter hongkongensis]|uniref:polyprenyl synthetase family protein n=1 Tax=Polycladidibacter hongkongensis TaxID=1647556 RepID=UPI00082F2AD6|nr:farnesyl diphosphate synthase [Pseudovibrio hongkongensis]